MTGVGKMGETLEAWLFYGGEWDESSWYPEEPTCQCRGWGISCRGSRRRNGNPLQALAWELPRTRSWRATGHEVRKRSDRAECLKSDSSRDAAFWEDILSVPPSVKNVELS